jgi:hypothetical protein
MEQVLDALWMTIELWIFLGILALYTVIEPFLVDKFSR